MENYQVVSEDNKVPETFKAYFETTVENLGFNSKYMSEEAVSDQSVTEITKIWKWSKYYKIKENHQGRFSFSAIELRDAYWENHQGRFGFSAVKLRDAYWEIHSLEPSKAIFK